LLGGKGIIAHADSGGDDEEEDKQVRQDFLFGIVEKVQVAHFFILFCFVLFCLFCFVLFYRIVL
jgi:hypothetical protein